MAEIPGWLGAIGALMVIATALGAAVAVYRTSVQGTSLRSARDTIADLRGEIADAERRETRLESEVVRLESEIKVLEAKTLAATDRCTVLEEVLSKRQGDDEIRAEIAAVREVVDKNVLTQLSAILQLLEGGASSTESGAAP
jgi:septal ring factor EnvC (AmiA/AmiB activator)